MKAIAVVAVACLAVSTEAQAGKRGKVKLQLSGQLNLNTATHSQLDQLPGIGEKAAKRIIEYRTKTPFAKVDDLSHVKGFGRKKLERLKPYLAVSGPTTLKVARLPGSELPPSTMAPDVQARSAPRPH
jgi:competence protein ComEA